MRIGILRPQKWYDFHYWKQTRTAKTKAPAYWEERVVMPKAMSIAVALYLRVPANPAIDCGKVVVPDAN